MTPHRNALLLDSAQQITEQDPRGNPVKHVRPGAGTAYRCPGELVTFVATSEETGGAFFLAEISAARGGGTPPHIHHREDESFHVLEGTLTISVGGNTIVASQGNFTFLPREVAHSFKNTGAVNTRALVLTTPGGLEGFFAEVFDPAIDRSTTPPATSEALIARAMAASPKYGLEPLPTA